MKYRSRIVDELEGLQGEHGDSVASFPLVAPVDPWVGVEDVVLIENLPTLGPAALLDRGPVGNQVAALGLVDHQGHHP